MTAARPAIRIRHPLASGVVCLGTVRFVSARSGLKAVIVSVRCASCGATFSVAEVEEMAMKVTR